MRASARTSRFWSSRSWNSSGIAADFSCWTSSASGSISAWRVGSALRDRVDLAGDAAQRGFHRRPVGFLRGGKLEPFLDAGDLHVAEQRVGFLHRRLRLGDELRLLRRLGGGGDLRRHHVGRERSMQRPGAAARSAVTIPASAPSEASAKVRDRQLVLLGGLVRDRALGERCGGHFEPGARNAVAAENAGGGGADDEEAGQRDDRRYPRQAALRFPRRRPITFTTTGN